MKKKRTRWYSIIDSDESEVNGNDVVVGRQECEPKLHGCE